MSTSTRVPWYAYALLVLTALIWSASWLFGRVMASAGVAPLEGSAARFLFGSAGLAVVMSLRRSWERPTRRDWILLGAMGMTGVVLYNVCFFIGLRTIPAARASLLASLQPAFVFIAALVIWREPATIRKIVGLLVGVTGAAYVLAQGHPGRLFSGGLNASDLWPLGCACCWAAYTMLGRVATRRIAPMAATAYSTWLGCAVLVPAALLAGGPQAKWTAKVWIAAAFLGLAGTTVAFLLYIDGVRRIGASRASIFITLVPVFAALLSLVFLNEQITSATAVGGALVVAGIYLLNR